MFPWWFDQSVLYKCKFEDSTAYVDKCNHPAFFWTIIFRLCRMVAVAAFEYSASRNTMLSLLDLCVHTACSTRSGIIYIYIYIVGAAHVVQGTHYMQHAQEKQVPWYQYLTDPVSFCSIAWPVPKLVRQE